MRLKWRWHWAASLRRTVHSVAISSGTHVALVAVLAMVAVNVEKVKAPSDAVGLDVGIGNETSGLMGGDLGSSAAVEITPLSTAVASLDSDLDGQELTQSESLSTSLQAEPELLLATSTAPERAAKPTKARGKRGKSTGKPGGTEDSQKTGAGSSTGATGNAAGGTAAADGKGTGNSFFGLPTYGQRIVFVVDISGSMDGRRFSRARKELRRSLEALQETQQFFVIFFSNGALPMPSPDLLPATKDNVAEALAWIQGVECGGGTQPLTSIFLAMRLHPDAIYLLTDGKFDPGVVWAVGEAEKFKRVPIYTIGFASRKAEKLLEAISINSGGVYRFVK